MKEKKKIVAFNAGVINAIFEIKSKTCRESSEYGWALYLFKAKT